MHSKVGASLLAMRSWDHANLWKVIEFNPFLTTLSFIPRHLFHTPRALQGPGQRVDFRSIDI